jgi:hypothetical protein
MYVNRDCSIARKRMVDKVDRNERLFRSRMASQSGRVVGSQLRAREAANVRGASGLAPVPKIAAVGLRRKSDQCVNTLGVGGRDRHTFCATGITAYRGWRNA